MFFMYARKTAKPAFYQVYFKQCELVQKAFVKKSE